MLDRYFQYRLPRPAGDWAARHHVALHILAPAAVRSAGQPTGWTTTPVLAGHLPGSARRTRTMGLYAGIVAQSLPHGQNFFFVATIGTLGGQPEYCLSLGAWGIVSLGVPLPDSPWVVRAGWPSSCRQRQPAA